MKVIGKPCEGKLHARFDEGVMGESPLLYSTRDFRFRAWLNRLDESERLGKRGGVEKKRNKFTHEHAIF